MPSMFVRMKPFGERKTTTSEIAGKLFAYGATIKDASVLAMTPPMVPGYGMASGVSLTMLDKTGGELDNSSSPRRRSSSPHSMHAPR